MTQVTVWCLLEHLVWVLGWAQTFYRTQAVVLEVKHTGYGKYRLLLQFSSREDLNEFERVARNFRKIADLKYAES